MGALGCLHPPLWNLWWTCFYVQVHNRLVAGSDAALASVLGGHHKCVVRMQALPNLLLVHAALGRHRRLILMGFCKNQTEMRKTILKTNPLDLITTRLSWYTSKSILLVSLQLLFLHVTVNQWICSSVCRPCYNQWSTEQFIELQWSMLLANYCYDHYYHKISGAYVASFTP